MQILVFKTTAQYVDIPKDLRKSLVINSVAREAGVSVHTLIRAIQGQPVRPCSMRRISAALAPYLNP